ncbi:bacillithiol biosynthesis cysteine-adding enzyme BshC [Jiulongibacter sp. NS-SX5]|uniref:bacillithiol biosynthesis cysteine-adding enzyme BshC n=1 Tax=Jiulongibacter sp. NS-SX5 TaxID=3463854 RepID=UPI00405A058D
MEYHCQRLPLTQTGAFSDLFLDYMSEKPELQNFYSEFPKIENFKKLIDAKSFSKNKREVLVSSLKKQYEGINKLPNIDLLNEENTFTVTTGHQLNIFSGPLYIPFKIITIINLTQELKKANPDYNFVPIYWMATEDHDLEEIQFTRAFSNKVFWDTPQTGAVGRMNTNGLPELANTLGKSADIFRKAYQENDTLAGAVRAYMHELFGEYGLITLDADDRDLKAVFSEVIKSDILENKAYDLVNGQTESLEKLGYKTQISAREINFFYLEEGLRERIVKEDERYKVLNTEIEFSKDEILKLIDTEPERFSPNVVLRPLYEEVILPNLAYIGGPSEVPYWLQLKPVFDFYKESFPALIPRNFGLLMDDKLKGICQKLTIDSEEIFKPLHVLEKEWIEKNSQNEVGLSVELKQLEALYDSLLQKAGTIDPTLQRTTEAFQTKSVNLLERLEKKLRRAEKRQHTDSMNQLAKAKELAFPGGGLQERKENIIPFLEKRSDLISVLIEAFDPLDFRFNLINI